MTDVESRSATFVHRLHEVRIRLGNLTSAPAPNALTGPDARTGERWDWGQVWAHTAEFPQYWLGQLTGGLAQDRGEPIPFGRVVSDPDRIAAIERDRGVPPSELWARTQPALDQLRDLIEGLGSREWAFRGAHSTLGELTMERILEEFVVGHLESHASQLEGLLAA